MSVHQCPECPLRFARKPELEWHLREEHPDFRHEYPAANRHGHDSGAHRQDQHVEASGAPSAPPGAGSPSS